MNSINKLQPYKILWWTIPIVLLIILCQSGLIIEFQIFDTYFVFALWHLAIAVILISDCMNTAKLRNYLIVIMCIMLLQSCQNRQKDDLDNIWANTTWEYLENEPIKFKKPAKLLRSSRYRLERDSPTISKDSAMLRVLQNTLEDMEFQDSNVDVFIDTTTYFHTLIIMNTSPINFGMADIAYLKKELESKNESAALVNPELKFSGITASMKQSGGLKLATFKSSISSTHSLATTYRSIHYLTSSSFSLIVHELSDYKSGFDNYLWSFKEI